MIILHAIVSLDPAAGGPPQVAYRLAQAQASLGHEVHLASYAGDAACQKRLQVEIRSNTTAGTVALHELSRPSRSELLFGWSARALFRELMPKVDVLHLHGVWESILRVGASEARRSGKPYVVAPHGMLDPWSLGQKKLKKQFALAMGYRSMVEGAAFVHCLNSDEERLLSPLHLGCRTRTIPNGIFVDDFAHLPAEGTFRRLHPEVGDDPFVLFLSRLHHKKGLDYLADAFGLLSAKLPSARLVVIGPDNGALADFQERIRAANLVERTHVLGPLYGADKMAALADAAVFCLPSRQEGFSIAILEAMACGVPLVLSENCHFPEVASAGAGYVVPLRAIDLADALFEVVSDSTNGGRMGECGRELVRRDYLWPAIARLSIDSYAQTLPTNR